MMETHHPKTSNLTGSGSSMLSLEMVVSARQEERWQQILVSLTRGLRYPLVHNLVALVSFLSPGEIRFRLFDWLFQKFDPQLVEDPSCNTNDISRTLRITTIASNLGLCGPNDMPLIQGIASSSTAPASPQLIDKQLDFIQTLVDMVLVSHQLSNSSSASPYSLLFNTNSKLLETIANQRESVFSEVESFPELHIFDQKPSQQQQQSTSTSQQQHRSFDLSKLQLQLADMCARLNEMCIQFQELNGDAVLSSEESGSPSINFSEEVNEFKKVCVEFNEAFDAEILHWNTTDSTSSSSSSSSSTNPTTSLASGEEKKKGGGGGFPLTGLGPLARQLHNQTTLLRSMMEKIGKVKEHHGKLNNLSVGTMLSTEVIGETAISQLTDSILVLETHLQYANKKP